MYKCANCGAEFEIPDHVIDIFNNPPREVQIDVCPDCGSDDIMEVE